MKLYRGLGQDDTYDSDAGLVNLAPTPVASASTNAYNVPISSSVIAGIDADMSALSPTSSGGSASSPSAIDQGLVAALNSGINAAAKVLGTRYAVPQTNPGQYVSTNAYGTTTYTVPTGSTSISASSLTSSLSSMLPLLLIGGAALLIFSMVEKH